MKRIVVAIVRRAGRVVDAILHTDTARARHQREMTRVQGQGGQDPAVGIAADTGYTQNFTGGGF